jgi:hypothetical protein
LLALSDLLFLYGLRDLCVEIHKISNTECAEDAEKRKLFANTYLIRKIKLDLRLFP